MTLSVVDFIAQDTDGNALNGASVSVREGHISGVGPLADIFSDEDGATPLSNPATTTASGTLRFYVQSGKYNLNASGSADSVFVDVPPPSDEVALQPNGPDSPIAQLSDAASDPEAQAAIGIGPRRVFISTAGTHVVNAADYSPALHLIVIPTSNTATLDCAGLAFNASYEFVNAQPSTTVTLDFGEDVYIRAPDISPGVVTVRTVDIPPNNRVTVIRLGGNQVFVDFGAPSYQGGSWEPTVYGSTTPGTQAYVLQQAKWWSIGEAFGINGKLVLSSTSGATGNLLIGLDGLPTWAVPKGNSNDVYPIGVVYQLNFTSKITGGFIEGNTNYISLWTCPAGDSVQLNASELTNTSRIYFGGVFLT